MSEWVKMYDLSEDASFQPGGGCSLVDVTVAPDQFGIPSNMFDELLQNVVPGSVRVTNP